MKQRCEVPARVEEIDAIEHSDTFTSALAKIAKASAASSRQNRPIDRKRIHQQLKLVTFHANIRLPFALSLIDGANKRVCGKSIDKL
jgi:hypothetical protein